MPQRRRERDCRDERCWRAAANEGWSCASLSHSRVESPPVSRIMSSSTEVNEEKQTVADAISASFLPNALTHNFFNLGLNSCTIAPNLFLNIAPVTCRDCFRFHASETEERQNRLTWENWARSSPLQKSNTQPKASFGNLFHLRIR